MGSAEIESLDEGRISFGDRSEDKEQTLDPVCGAKVDRHDRSTSSAARRGSVYYFCSAACKARFLEDPDAYV
jgi:P-type Cu+ transporter